MPRFETADEWRFSVIVMKMPVIQRPKKPCPMASYRTRKATQLLFQKTRKFLLRCFSRKIYFSIKSSIIQAVTFTKKSVLSSRKNRHFQYMILLWENNHEIITNFSIIRDCREVLRVEADGRKPGSNPGTPARYIKGLADRASPFFLLFVSLLQILCRQYAKEYLFRLPYHAAQMAS
jgi:hypothetical protein